MCRYWMCPNWVCVCAGVWYLLAPGITHCLARYHTHQVILLPLYTPCWQWGEVRRWWWCKDKIYTQFGTGDGNWMTKDPIRQSLPFLTFFSSPNLIRLLGVADVRGCVWLTFDVYEVRRVWLLQAPGFPGRYWLHWRKLNANEISRNQSPACCYHRQHRKLWWKESSM